MFAALIISIALLGQVPATVPYGYHPDPGPGPWVWVPSPPNGYFVTVQPRVSVAINADRWLNSQRDIGYVRVAAGYYDCDRDYRLKRTVRKLGLGKSIRGVYPALLYQRPLFFLGVAPRLPDR